METQFRGREGSGNGHGHPILGGDDFERLQKHVGDYKLISAEEERQLLEKHRAAEAERSEFEKMDVRDQVAKMKGEKSFLAKLRSAVEKVTGI